MNILTKTAATALLLFGTVYSASAQVSDIRDTGAVGCLTRAEAMLATGNAIGAIDQLNMIQQLQLPAELPADLQQKALYLRCQALFECDDEQCMESAREYIILYDGTPQAQQLRMLRGDYRFFHADYEQALREYEMVQSEALDPAQRDELVYRRALTYLRLANYDTASEMFQTLLGSRQYAEPARFYLAYIDYINGDYRRARKGFERYVLNYDMPDRKRRSLIPVAPDASYYVAQIDFAEGNYRQVASEVPSLLKHVNDPAVEAELRRICGESLYNLGQQQQAEPYLRKYLKSAGTEALPTARYMLGVICYDRQDYTEAANCFEPVASQDDELGQSASLYLGQCEMKLGEPGAATVAFERAYRMGYDAATSEAALYNYATMVASGSSVPFARSSVELLEQFVKKYPKSEFAANAEEYLAGAYFNEKDYRRALESINRIPDPSPNVLQAKQKILYELGVETLTNGQPKEAATYMEQASAMTDANSEVATRALLWLGDAYYNSGNYPRAVQSYRQFLQKSSASDPNRGLAQYNLGYALYQQSRYAEARKCFEAALSQPGELNSSLLADARTRIADCMYASGQHKEAMEMYREAMEMGAANADYAALQRANMLGLMGSNTEKVQALDEMLTKYPTSSWAPSAMLEKAQTYITLGNDEKAMESFQQLVKRYPQAPESRQGLLQMAITYSNAGKTDRAIELYKEILTKWPTSEQAQAANEDLRMLYANRGELDSYAQFLKSIPGAPSLNPDEIDRLTYEAAENALIENPDDIAPMQRYISNYPNGAYIDRALYAVARSMYTNGKYGNSLELLNKLLSQRPDSKTAPEALLLKAEIYENTDLGSRRDALTAWRELLQRGGAAYYADACAGIMRNTDNPTESIQYANRLLNSGGLSTEQMDEALYYRAMGEMKQQQYTQAIADLKQLAQNPVSLYGARAAVDLAEHYISTRQLEDAQKLLEAFTDSGTPHQYWLARGFIDLADVYYAQGRKTLARQYVKSLEENYPGAESDIRKMISDRLSKWK